MVVRIQGLVKLADTVRVEIGRGMGGERKRQLQQTVFRSIERIDQILQQRGAMPAQLAAPSRRAYQFLREIRWDAIAESAAADQNPAPQHLRWTGLGRFAERMMARLAAQPPEGEIGEIAAAIEQMSRRIELSIQQAGVGPEHLTAPTREWRGWLAWLAERENLNEYLAAVRRANEAIGTIARAAGNQNRLLPEFRPIRHIYKMLTRNGNARLLFPTPMVRLDQSGFADMGKLIFNGSKDAKRSLAEWMRTEEYLDLSSELEGLAGVVEGMRGAFYDLSESFDRVNARYFAEQMPRPRLTWSRSFTGRKFGHYDHVKDWVMVSSTLDRAGVPAFVVDYLMFHELLHKKHGIRWLNGRRHAHTREYYAEERQFERYDEADAWLTRLSRA
jgi:hypothetical protein